MYFVKYSITLKFLYTIKECSDIKIIRKNPLILQAYCLNPNNLNTFNLNDKNIRIHIIENFRLHLKVQIINLRQVYNPVAFTFRPLSEIKFSLTLRFL